MYSQRVVLALACCIIVSYVPEVSGQCEAGSCVCDLPEGRIDLRRLVIDIPGYFSYKDEASVDSYYYNLCGNGVSYQKCDPSSAMCQVLHQTDQYYNLGQLQSEKIIVEGSKYELQYGNGDGERESIVKLVCDMNAHTARFTYKGEFVQKRYDFQLITRCACPDGCNDGGPLPPPHSPGNSNPSDSGQSVAAGAIGITLMAVSIVAILTYFIVGGIVLHTKYEKRGTEVIPQKSFWLALPLLVKDGFVFTFNPLLQLIRKRSGHSQL